MKSKKYPKNVSIILDEIINIFTTHLQDNLVGIYLHGSLVMGCFNPQSSDIDFLVICRTKLDIKTKKEIIKSILALYESKHINKKGIEFSVVLQRYLKKFIYPTPYELHFLHSWKVKYEKNLIDLTKEEKDTDLAVHFGVVNELGATLYGQPILKVFPKTRSKYYIMSLIEDFEWSLGNVLKGPDSGKCAVPTYAVLNFCRVLAYIKTKKIISKCEGGKWGLKNMPKEYKPVILEAMKEYTKSNSSKKVDAKLLKQYANYISEEITKAKKRFI